MQKSECRMKNVNVVAETAVTIFEAFSYFCILTVYL